MGAEPNGMLFYGFVFWRGDAPDWLAQPQDDVYDDLWLHEPYSWWILSRLAEGDTASVPDGDALQAEFASFRAARKQDRKQRATALEQRLTELGQRETCTLARWRTDYPSEADWLVYVSASKQANAPYREHDIDVDLLTSAPIAAWNEQLAAFARRLGLPARAAAWKLIGCCPPA
jgi:hypothetical protein